MPYLPLQWHAYAQTFRDLAGEEWDAFVQDIANRGQQLPIRYRVNRGVMQGLDGRQRERACIQLGIEPHREKVFVDDHDIVAYIDSLNKHRRGGQSPELRQKEVAKQRAEGQSTRQIAANLGVSHTTVRNDLYDISETSVGNQFPPDATPNGETFTRENEEIIVGSDGKQYKAVKPRKKRKPKPSGTAWGPKDDKRIADTIHVVIRLLEDRRRAKGEKGYDPVRKAIDAAKKAFNTWAKS